MAESGRRSRRVGGRGWTPGGRGWVWDSIVGGVVGIWEGNVREWWGICGRLPGCVGLCRVLDSILLAKHAILVQCVRVHVCC